MSARLLVLMALVMTLATPPAQAETRTFFNPAVFGKPVTLAAMKPGVSHRWTGTISGASFSHGFLNVIQPDMHLHVRAGAIADWREGPEGTFGALDTDGKAIGLTLTA